MRSIFKVVDGMMCEIPHDKEELRLELGKMISSYAWSAPETIGSSQHWSILSNILSKHITTEDYTSKNWCKKVIDIFQNPDYECVDKKVFVPTRCYM